MQGGAVGIGRAGRGRTECRHWIGIEDRGFGMYVCMYLLQEHRHLVPAKDTEAKTRFRR